MVGHNAVTDRRTIRAPSLPSAAATTLRLQRTNSTSNIETPRDLPILKRELSYSYELVQPLFPKNR